MLSYVYIYTCDYIILYIYYIYICSLRSATWHIADDSIKSSGLEVSLLTGDLWSRKHRTWRWTKQLLTPRHVGCHQRESPLLHPKKCDHILIYTSFHMAWITCLVLNSRTSQGHPTRSELVPCLKSCSIYTFSDVLRKSRFKLQEQRLQWNNFIHGSLPTCQHLLLALFAASRVCTTGVEVKVRLCHVQHNVWYFNDIDLQALLAMICYSRGDFCLGDWSLKSRWLSRNFPKESKEAFLWCHQHKRECRSSWWFISFINISCQFHDSMPIFTSCWLQ